MKRNELRDEVQTETRKLAATVSDLQSEFDPRGALKKSARGFAAFAKDAAQHLARNPVAAAMAGAGLAWLLLGKRAKKTKPHWPEDKGGPVSGALVLQTRQMQDATPKAVPTDMMASGIAALALGVAAAALLPRSTTEDRVLGGAGKKLRRTVSAAGEGAISLVGETARQKSVDVIWTWEGAVKNALDGVVEQIERAADEIVQKVK